MDSKRSHRNYSDQETARRRDDVLRHMISRRPQPHKSLGAGERKTRPPSKGRVHKAKARS